MTNQEAVARGAQAARQESVLGWGVFGICLPLIAVLVAACRTPSVSPRALATHNDEATQWFFASEYTRVLKSRRVEIALLGAALGIVIALALLFCLSLAMASFAPF